MSEQQRKHKILWIEDDPEIIKMGQLILQKHGYEVIGALGGAEGLERLPEVQPDLVLLDWMMPEVDGIQVYQHMRADDALSHIPVVVVTAKGKNIDEVLWRSLAGADDYLKKPFDATTLINCVKSVLGDEE